MKFTTLCATAAFAASTVAVSSAAFAGPVDYSGSSVNMSTVSIGQFGTITDLYKTLFSIPPNQIGGGAIYGLLPQNAKITFSYTFTGLIDGNLGGNTSYHYNNGGNVFDGSAHADSTGTHYSAGTVNGVNSAPLVFAAANLNVVNPGTSTGSVSFINVGSNFASFEAIFSGFLTSTPRGVGSATYAVSSIPLPAALPMFASLLAGMFGFARFGRKKALAA